MGIKKVIPCLDVKDGRVVKGVQFVDLKDQGDPVEFARRYEEQGADELVFLDITATTEGRGTTIDLAARVGASINIPFCVGGGFRTVEDIEKMISAGANKVSINSAAVANPDMLSQAAAKFGNKAIVCAIDVAQAKGNPNKWEVLVAGGKKNTGIDAVEWAREVERRGAAEILLTSLDCDGAQDGYDIPATRAIARAVNIPVTASGGVGKLEHFAEGILEGEADAVLAASVFHFGTFTVRQVKEYLRSQGIEVAL